MPVVAQYHFFFNIFNYTKLGFEIRVLTLDELYFRCFLTWNYEIESYLQGAKLHISTVFENVFTTDRRDGVVATASALQSVDLGFNPLVKSYQKTLKSGIHSFPPWR